ncbi:hypothetical protein LINPERPRIM_LOCUS39339 [Linum perenne]
MIRRRQKDSQ